MTMTGCDVSGGGAGSVRGASVHPPQHREPPATLPRIKLGSPSQTRRARTMWSRSRSLGVPTGETSLLLTILQPRGSTRPRAGPRTCGGSVGTLWGLLSADMYPRFVPFSEQCGGPAQAGLSAGLCRIQLETPTLQLL